MSKSNAAAVASYRQRAAVSYTLMKELAMSAGFMTSSRDGDGFDRFIAAVEKKDGDVRIDITVYAQALFPWPSEDAHETRPGGHMPVENPI